MGQFGRCFFHAGVGHADDADVVVVDVAELMVVLLVCLLLVVVTLTPL